MLSLPDLIKPLSNCTYPCGCHCYCGRQLPCLEH